MNLFINIISIAGPLIFAAGIFALKNIPAEMKIGLWIVCALILVSDLYLIIKDKKAKEEKSKREELYNRLYQRQELFDRNLPGTVTDVLDRNPLLKESFRSGQKHEKEYEFEEAIKVYEKCLQDLSIPEEDKIGFNILIGSCYYFFSKLNKAEKNFKESLNNIGSLYNELGKYDEALKCQEEALEISQKFKDEQAIANSLTNIGIIYTDSGKPEEALKLFQEALEINEKNKSQEGIANVFNNMGLAYSNLKETDQALNYYQKALKINKKIGYKEGAATNLGNIGLIYITLGKSEEVLKYYQEALEIFINMNAQPRIEILLKLIKIIEEE